MSQEKLRKDLRQNFQSCTFNRSVTSPYRASWARITVDWFKINIGALTLLQSSAKTMERSTINSAALCGENFVRVVKTVYALSQSAKWLAKIL